MITNAIGLLIVAAVVYVLYRVLSVFLRAFFGRSPVNGSGGSFGDGGGDFDGGDGGGD